MLKKISFLMVVFLVSNLWAMEEEQSLSKSEMNQELEALLEQKQLEALLEALFEAHKTIAIQVLSKEEKVNHLYAVAKTIEILSGQDSKDLLDLQDQQAKSNERAKEIISYCKKLLEEEEAK